MPKPGLRAWQARALALWESAGHRGIISVVTGGGKTVLALACIEALRAQACLIVVPTAALLDQWWEEVASYFDLSLDEVSIIEGRKRFKLGAINIAVINTAARLAEQGRIPSCFLIVDECHKAASEHFGKILSLPTFASLGLSATPERAYDDGLRDLLIPALGDVIYQYGYGDALRDQIIVPFELRNIVFELDSETQAEYNKLTRAIGRSIQMRGVEARETVLLMIRRTRVLNLSPSRVRLTLRLIASRHGKRTLVFHEDIAACDVINEVLRANGIVSGVYHSGMPLRQRAEALRDFRSGQLDVLVTCRALDEGFNVPEAEIGIIAASTATRRQRIQRLGRIVRPAKGKRAATIFTLVATQPEIERLREEEANLAGVADVNWSKA